MKKLLYRLEAASDVETAFAWYDQQRPGLGAAFLDALSDAEHAVRSAPTAYRVVRRDTRRYLLRRFPYQLLYRILGDCIVIVACFHIRRSPRRIDHRR